MAGLREEGDNPPQDLAGQVQQRGRKLMNLGIRVSVKTSGTLLQGNSIAGRLGEKIKDGVARESWEVHGALLHFL